MNELLRDLNGTPSSTTDFINQYNNFKVPDTLISTNSNPITQHQADDEEEDVIDNEEDDAEDDQDQFFSIVPQNQHGHKFANLQAPQPVSNTGSNTLNNGPVTTATPSGAMVVVATILVVSFHYSMLLILWMIKQMVIMVLLVLAAAFQFVSIE